MVCQISNPRVKHARFACSTFPKFSSVIPESVREEYSHADYMNIPVSKGRHTIKVQNCGGLSWFDELRIKAHSPSDGVEVVSVDDANSFDGVAVYYDLQGRKVLNPSNGLYIVKRGNKVSKEVIR